MKKIISVVGARPNFMKMAPVHKAFLHSGGKVKHLICHTGQHYDEKMSKVFFEDLELPKPDFYLGVGSGSHAEQTARIMIEFEKVLTKEKPDLIIVYGDVNSTVACALTAVKLNIQVAHVEAGLRSFDRTMPEEINRILTDRISDFLFVSEPSGIENLKREGVDDSKIFFVGNTMIDSLVEYLPKAEKSDIRKKLEIEDSEYVLVTMHRPSNVDNLDFLKKFVEMLNTVAENKKVVFPVHPRTKKNFENWSIIEKLSENILLTEPIPYIEFISLIKYASLVLTDSGGIQEETTYLGVPCLTLRENTERPVTVDIGTNKLLGQDITKVFGEVVSYSKKGSVPELWDGESAKRIVKNISELINAN